MQFFSIVQRSAAGRAQFRRGGSHKVIGRLSRSAAGLIWLVAVVTASAPALAGGEAGKRFFPATIATDDPFAADEFAPQVSTIRQPGEGDEPTARETEFSAEYSKRITPDLALGIGLGGTRIDPDGGSPRTGLNNLELSLKYQFFENDRHETILSAGLGAEVGGTGDTSVGADTFSTLTPAFFFGKGLGDLPDSMALFKPFAVTGVIGVALPTESSTKTVSVDPDTGDLDVEVERHPNTFVSGLAIEYNLHYLQSNVRNMGLPELMDGMIPLIEFAFETPLDRGGGVTTGSINPGVIWAGETWQFGIEAIVPINTESGHGVGVRAGLDFYLDDLFPHTIGKPLFGHEREEHD